MRLNRRFMFTAGAGVLVITALGLIACKMMVDMGPAQPDISLADIRHLKREDYEIALVALTVAATQKSAWIAELALLLSAISLVGLAATVLAALYSAWLQERTTRAELRPYLAVSAHISGARVGQRPVLHVEVTNKGVTLALEVTIALAIRYQSADKAVKIITDLPEPFPPVSMLPGTKTNAKQTLEKPLTLDQVNELASLENDKGHMLTGIGQIKYSDYAGDRHQTNFAFYFYGEDCLQNGNLDEGNSAT